MAKKKTAAASVDVTKKKTRKKRGPNKKKQGSTEPLVELVGLFQKTKGKKATDNFDIDEFSTWVLRLKKILASL